MQIKVNGEGRDMAPGATVAALLEALGLRRDGVAVAINRRVVPRSQHPARQLEDGDEVEVIQAVGGG